MSIGQDRGGILHLRAGNIAGSSMCLTGNVPTTEVSVLKGSVQVCLKPSGSTPLPTIDSPQFKADMHQALAAGMGVAPADFKSFNVSAGSDPTCVLRRLAESSSLQDDKSAALPQLRLKGRRLARVAQSAKLDYEVRIHDPTRVDELKTLLETMADPTNTLVQAFSAHLAKKDYAVSKTTVITPPQVYTETVIVTPSPPTSTTDEDGLGAGSIVAIVLSSVLLACCGLACCCKLAQSKRGG